MGLTLVLTLGGAEVFLVAGPVQAGTAVGTTTTLAGPVRGAEAAPTADTHRTWTAERPAAHRRAERRAHRRARAAAVKKAAAKRAAARRVAERHAARRHAARLARVRPGDPRTWIRFSPRHVSPDGGPHFNNPYGPTTERRRLLDQVIDAIDSSPGYRRPGNPRTHRAMSCPTDPRLAPSSIKIAVYSIADPAFGEAVAAAHERCVSVQVLMNSHLTVDTSHSWRAIIDALGPRGTTWRHRASFAHRCSFGCLGTAVLHSKFYLFSRAGSRRHTVMVGSSNMTRNAIGIQWNDLFTVNDNTAMYDQYGHMFRAMSADRKATGPWTYRAGRYTSTFFPDRRATPRTDPVMRAMRSVRCGGANGGSGIAGHTVVYIAMHAWNGIRGRWLAGRVRQLYDQGCYVRILYSFMGYEVFRSLVYGTGPRMTVRRVLFPGPLGVVASKYSHIKLLAISGHRGTDRSSWSVWTGSDNWVDRSLHADEVTLQIPTHSAYRAYVRHWKVIRHRRSSGFWATFQEPVGGGRSPA